MEFSFISRTKDAPEKPSLPSLATKKEAATRKTPGSAKQHYLQRSRYYPGAPTRDLSNMGIEGKVYDLGSGKKVVELTSGSMKGSARGTIGSLERTGYVTSFEEKKPKPIGVVGMQLIYCCIYSFIEHFQSHQTFVVCS